MEAPTRIRDRAVGTAEATERSQSSGSYMSRRVWISSCPPAGRTQTRSCRQRAHLDPSAPGLESEGGWHYGTVLSTSTSGRPAAQTTAPVTGSLSVAASTAVPVACAPRSRLRGTLSSIVGAGSFSDRSVRSVGPHGGGNSGSSETQGGMRDRRPASAANIKSGRPSFAAQQRSDFIIAATQSVLSLCRVYTGIGSV